MMVFYQKLSASERRLAVLTILVLALVLVFLGILHAKRQITELDENIASLEADLVYNTQLAAHADSVNKAFDAIAAQHSSQWTQEEIHDRLRREITRLSLRNVPPLGQEIPAPNAGNLLVDIRSMPSGALEDSGEGYRGYTISFRTEPTQAANIATFLERLQRSEQALRIDTLDLTRQPANSLVTATIKVTRTVIGEGPAGNTPKAVTTPAAPQTGNRIQNGGFEQWDAKNNAFPNWTAEGCTVSQAKESTEGSVAMQIVANEPNARVYQTLQLQGATTYELVADIRVSGSAQLQVIDGATNKVFPGGEPLVADKVFYRYAIRFTTPGDPGSTVPIQAPSIVLQEKGLAAHVDNVSVEVSKG